MVGPDRDGKVDLDLDLDPDRRLAAGGRRHARW